VKIDGYSIKICTNNRTIVSCDEFSAPQNKVTFLFGESGIGKSLLCKALYGLIDPEELDVTVNAKPYSVHLNNDATKNIFNDSFFVFQEPSSHLNPLMRIGEQICEGSLYKTGTGRDILRRLWQTSDDSVIDKILTIYPKPYRPSGGEKQRVLLAMAFEKIDIFIKALSAGKTSSHRRSLFVFDEPTGSLDNNYRNIFLDLLFEKYSILPFTIMFITHDYSIISEIYNHHEKHIPHIYFSELSRISDDGKVEQHDFSPQEYLEWLEVSAPPSYTSAADRKEVLHVDPSFSIFGNSHRICSDSLRKHETPLVINSGEMVYIKAASGVGKTTLAKIIMGLYKPDIFSMQLSGISLTNNTPLPVWARCIWGKKAGMVFQHADESLDFEANILETFNGLKNGGFQGADKIKSAMSQLFDASQITGSFLKRKTAYLSGGQKQRLNLLRTLVLSTDLIILDEPLNGLDFKGVKRVLCLLETIRKQEKAILLISHNEEIFDKLIDADHTYYLS
jgi:peptide/nickel transport system ATP-binding protein